MDQTISLQDNTAGMASDQRLAEINYHRKLNRRFVFTALPGFVFFAVFHFFHGNFFPSAIFTLLSINAVVTVVWSLYINDLNQLILIKRVGTSIAFTLLAVILAGGFFSEDVYLVVPWIYTYPVAVLLMFGERIGIFFAAGFCTIICVILVIIDLPSWNIAAMISFKFSSAFALISLLTIALVAERTRVRMRNELLEARNKYMAAEKRQRLTNEELKIEIEMRVKSEKLLSQSEIRYRALFEESAVSLWEENHAAVKTFLDSLPETAIDNLELYLKQNPTLLKKCIDHIWITTVNRASLNLYEAADIRELLSNVSKVLPLDVLDWMAERITALYRTGRYQNQVTAQTINGRKLNLLVSSTVPAGYETSWEKVYTSVNDITERVTMEEEKKRVEKQVHHARRIQAIAALAGGIAHQFNNALAVIVGNIDLLELKTPPTSEVEPQIDSLRKSSEHMRRLTEQLLAYAKGGKYRPIDFSAEELIRNFLRSNDRLQEAGIPITTQFEKDVILSGSDTTQITSVMEAVLFNAVEATNNRSEITISTRNLTVEKGHQLVHEGLEPGHYALITIEDHGVGMDDETRQRIFDPFFSTKFVGRGLGMASAYGIVRNHHGVIEVESQPDKGTRVMIYLPRIVKQAELTNSDD